MTEQYILDQSLVYKNKCPIEICILDDTNPSIEYKSYLNATENALQVLLFLDQSTLNETEEDNKEFMLEIKRLDAKVNLLLHWVGGLVKNSSKLPDVCEMKLGSRHVEIKHLQNISLKRKVLVKIHISETMPLILQLPGVIELSEKIDEAELYKIIVRFIDDLGPSELLLEKYIFQSHRRDVAKSRINK